jgi:hypothetical protein
MVDVLSTLAGVGLLAIASITFACVLRIRGRAAFAGAALVITGAIIVLSTIVLSLPKDLTRGGLLLCEAVVAAVAAGAWIATGRPRPVGGWRPRVGEARIAVSAHPALAVLVGMAIAAAALALVLTIAVAPSNWDSMTYHLSRAAYWLQQHSARQIPGGSLRQLNSAPNGEILQAWTMGITGTDRFVGVVQWLSLLGVAACVYLGARLLDFARGAALFAAALFVVLPEPILQASSTQNDLVVALFVAAAAVFGMRGLRDGALGDLVVAALAVGLAIGTKGTTLALLPSLAIIFAVTAWRARTARRVMAAGLAAAVVAVVALGAWGYVLNLHGQRSLFGNLTQATKREAKIPSNAVRVVWTFADSPGVSVPWFDAIATKAAHVTVGHLEIPNQFGFFADSAISEDTSAYGIVGWWALLPVLVFFMFSRRAGPRRLLAGAGLVGLAAFAVAFEYNIWVGRLLLPTVALVMPLCAVLARRGVPATLTVIAAALTLVPCLLLNPNKMLLVTPPAPTAMAKDRIDQMTVLRPEMAPVIRAVGQRIGDRGALAFVGSEDSWDYPFFGEHRERRVIRFSSPAQIDPAKAIADRLRGVLFANVGRPARLWHARQIGGDYWLAALR